jgi:hypothetical protein
MTRRFVLVVFVRAIGVTVAHYGRIALNWAVALGLVAFVLVYIAALAWVGGSLVVKVVTS